MNMGSSSAMGLRERKKLMNAVQRDLLFKEDLEREVQRELKQGNPNVDKKKLRRIISNRLSAQRSRECTVQYTQELEKKCHESRDRVWVLNLQVENTKEKNKLSLLEFGSLQEKIERLEAEAEVRNMKEIALRLELQMLQLQIGNVQDPNPELEPALNFDLTLNRYPTLSLYQESMQNLQKDSSVKEMMPSGSTFEQSAEDGSHMPEDPWLELVQDLAMKEGSHIAEEPKIELNKDVAMEEHEVNEMIQELATEEGFHIAEDPEVKLNQDLAMEEQEVTEMIQELATEEGFHIAEEPAIELNKDLVREDVNYPNFNEVNLDDIEFV